MDNTPGERGGKPTGLQRNESYLLIYIFIWEILQHTMTLVNLSALTRCIALPRLSHMHNPHHAGWEGL